MNSSSDILSHFRKFRKKLPFPRRKIFWYQDLICYKQVTKFTILFINRKALPFQTGLLTILCFRFYLEPDFPFKGIHSDVTTQYGSIQVEIQRNIKIIAQPFKNRIRCDPERNIQITIGAAIGSGCAVILQTNHLPILYSCGDGYTNIFFIDGQGLAVCFRCVAQREMEFRLVILPPEFGTTGS